MGKKSSPSPDPSIAENASKMAEISQENWDWFKDTYLPAQTANQQGVQSQVSDALSQYTNNLLPSQEGAYGDTAGAGKNVQQTALSQMQGLGETGKEMNDLYRSDYLPIYGQIASEAAAKGGQADQDYQSMMARGDVAQANANQNDQLQRYLAQYGQSPVSGLGVAGARTAAIGQAAQEAAAQTAARQAALNLGWQYRQQAATVGAGLLNQGNATQSQALQAGAAAQQATQNTLAAGNALSDTLKAAINTSTVPVTSQSQIGQGLAQGAAASTGASSGSSSALNQQYATQANAQAAQNAGTASAIGSVAGAIGTGVGAYYGNSAGKGIGAISGSGTM